MTTSGTVGSTVLDTAKVIEHAFRRCKVHPSKQTPETVILAQESLYLLLTHLANNGINLWAVSKHFVGCEQGLSVYQCPVGTVDLLNLIYSQPTRTTGTNTTVDVGFTTEITTDLGSATSVTRVGAYIGTDRTNATLDIYSSSNNIQFNLEESITQDWTRGWQWFDLSPTVTAQYYKVTFSTPNTLTDTYLATAVYDLPVTPWSRDTWAAINNKTQQGRPSTTYWFEKLVRPQVTIWPVPNNDYDHLTMFVHRQVQDVGTLTQTLDIPNRWYETVVWQLALRLSFELPTELVPLDVANLVKGMADQYTFEVFEEEADGMPLFITPSIRGYTR